MKGELAILPLAAPLRREIEARLRAAITQGRFHAGERLIERELCEMLGVSRPSLREALRQLEAEELVTLRPNRGPAVAEVTLEEVREIYEMRATLEGLAARLFTLRASDAQVEKLRQALREMKKVEGGSLWVLLLDRKNKFYEVLLTGCGNHAIQRVLNQLHNRLRLLRAEILAGRAKAALGEVARIVGAVERRDADAACAAAMQHIERAGEVAIQSLERRQQRSSKTRVRRH